MEPGGIEAAGDAVTGGLLGHALEPATGLGGAGEHGAICLNCGTALVGSHCHQCGQPAHVHRSLAAFFHDLAHGVLHFEGKIWRTLPLLVWRPGALTRRYVDGQRANFVSPIALFLFFVFLMFGTFSWVGGPLGAGRHEEAKAGSELVRDQRRLTAELRGLEAQRVQLAQRGASTVAVDARIKGARQGLAATNILDGKPATTDGGDLADIDFGDESGPLKTAYQKAAQNPSLLFYKLETNAYKFSWLLIPLSVPFLWLLFLHRRRYRASYKAYDHIVFVTYSLCFMTALVVALSVLHALGLSNGAAFAALAFVPPLHMYRQLRGAYALSLLSAAWRTAALIVFAVTAMAGFMLILVALGLLG